MTTKQIMDRFDSIESRQLLLKQRQKCFELRKLLELENLKENKLLKRLSKEENKVANKLDKEFPKWRETLINEVKKNYLDKNE